MYQLYYDSGGSNMAPHAALKEIGAAHELIRIDLDKGEQRSPAYLKINPHGRVPTLVHGDIVMFESAAILMYLCDRHPEAGLAPAASDPAPRSAICSGGCEGAVSSSAPAQPR